MPKILFLTTAHRHDDDRIFYHQAKALKNEGYQVKICSLSSDFQGTTDGIEIESYPVLDKSTEEKKQFLKKYARIFSRIASSVRNRWPLLLLKSLKSRRKRYVSFTI
uniref:Glycosyltransferase subfamily 4-like N-terminal domain-containing protein n=1 Tax=Chryseobacterium endophyticum TaxID=1854762 RepID=A0AAU6WQI7_9FLAO